MENNFLEWKNPLILDLIKEMFAIFPAFWIAYNMFI